MSGSTSHPVLWDEVYDVLLHVFSHLSLKELKVVRLVCRNWEEASRPAIQKKGRLHWVKILLDLSDGRVDLSTLEGRLVGFRNALLCPHGRESALYALCHKELDYQRICLDRLDPDLKEFAFPFVEDYFIADAAIYVSFMEYRSYIYDLSAIYFMDRFVEGVNQGKFHNLATVSLEFGDNLITGWSEESYSNFLFKEGSLPKVRKLKLCNNGQLMGEGYVPAILNSLLAAAPNVSFLEADFPGLDLTTLRSLTQLHVHFVNRVRDSISSYQLVPSLLSMLTGVENRIKILSLKGMVFKSGFALPVFPNVEQVSLEDVWLLEGNIATLFPSLKRLSVATEWEETCEALSEYLTIRSWKSPLEFLELGITMNDPNPRVETWRRLPPIMPPTKTLIFWLHNHGDYISNASKDDSLRFLEELEHPNVIVKVWRDTRISSLIMRLQNLQLKGNYCKDGKAIEFHFATVIKGYENGRWKRIHKLEDDSQISKFPKVMKLLAKKWSSIKIKYFYITQRQFNVMTEGVAAKSLPVEIFCGVIRDDSTFKHQHQKNTKNGIIRRITRIFK